MDPTPLPGAEELYASAPCGLMVAAHDGRLLRVNATLCAWLAYAEDELVGHLRLNELLTMGGRIFYQTHLQPLLRMQASVAEVKLEVRRKDGKVLPVMMNIAERVHAGQVQLHAAVFLAEERHQYERELLLQRKRAEQLAEQHANDQRELAGARAEAEDRALFAEQLVGVVSHDIRNPLSVIHMSALLLERSTNPEQQKAAVARVTRAVQRVQHLIGDLLDFSQARLGRGLTVRKAPADLHQAIADSVSELGVAFPGRVLRHERSGDGQCMADADRIVQAVGNLVANAVNHGAPDQPITVRSEGDGSRFRVAVHNLGKPIPESLIPQLFEPMVRGIDAGGGQGVGLGLFIVRAIVAAHGGRVDVQSSAEAGTTFALELPCAG